MGRKLEYLKTCNFIVPLRAISSKLVEGMTDVRVEGKGWSEIIPLVDVDVAVMK